jgi:hypothetical protein
MRIFPRIAGRCTHNSVPGRIVKVIFDAGPGGQNGPSWQDGGHVDPSLYVPAIDPSLP